MCSKWLEVTWNGGEISKKSMKGCCLEEMRQGSKQQAPQGPSVCRVNGVEVETQAPPLPSLSKFCEDFNQEFVVR